MVNGELPENRTAVYSLRFKDLKCIPILSHISHDKSLVTAGIFLPTCDEDGYYKATQCHSSVGQCWCVDRYGNELGGSRSGGPSDCGMFYTHLITFDPSNLCR